MVDRYRREGLAGLNDRSSRPHRLRRPTPPKLVEQIALLRRQRRTGQQIATGLGLSPATIPFGSLSAANDCLTIKVISSFLEQVLRGNRMTLQELRDLISDDQISRDEVIAALHESHAENDGCVQSRIKQAITSANIYYSSRRWGAYRTLDRAKARLIADIAKVAA